MSAPFICSSAAPSTTSLQSATRCSTPFAASSNDTTRWSSSTPTRQPIDICLDEVRKSDLLVVIVGLRYGSLPLRDGDSPTRRPNTRRATGAESPTSYIRDDDVPILPKYVERDPDKLRLLDAGSKR